MSAASRTDLAIGLRVFIPHEGNFGTIEVIYGDDVCPDGRRWLDVRRETPDGEPSVSVTCLTEDLVLYPVPANLVPRPVSREWRRRSALFHAALARIIRQEFPE